MQPKNSQWNWGSRLYTPEFDNATNNNTENFLGKQSTSKPVLVKALPMADIDGRLMLLRI
jgi:hypothetical protein